MEGEGEAMVMTPSERKFLFVMVRDSLRRSSDKIEARHESNKHLPTLRSLGYVKDDEVGEIAFQEYFDGYELVSCPTEMQRLLDLFKIEVQWRRPHGFIKDQFDTTGSGKAFPACRTVFIAYDATPQTWFHEFGHLLYWRLKNKPDLLEISKTLQEVALREYPVVTHEQMTLVIHPKTRDEVPPAPGRYILIDGRYFGLDHSGDGADVEADELWAVLFTEYQMGRTLRQNVRVVVEELVAALQSVPNGQRAPDEM
jgi:hypothetical protein